jgi:hypothetical protein
VVCGARPGQPIELRSQPSRHTAEGVWDELGPQLDPKQWKTLTVAPGTLTDAQLAALRKKFPKV